MERSGLRFEHFCLEVVENRQKKNIAYFGIFLDVFEFFAFWIIFAFFKMAL